jgi:phthalate 4,5-cis-dihydrodiol dehydrogenase
MITAMNFTDFLYRPRRPEELDTSRGGGAVFSQAAHQVDVVRYLAGARAVAVRATTGNWDMSRPTEGAYAAHLTFENGVFASLTYSGYAHFDSDRYQGWIGETGKPRDPLSYGEARRRIRALESPEDEIVLKNAAGYGVTAGEASSPRAYHHFGLIIVSCDKGDLRPTPFGVEIYGDQTRAQEDLPTPVSPRGEVIDEIFGVLRNGEEPTHTGEWGMATVETCLALLTSSREGRVVDL